MGVLGQSILLPLFHATLPCGLTSSNPRGYPPIPLSVSSRGCRLTYIPLNVTYSYCRFIYCNKQGQTPLRMRIDHIFCFLQMLGHISPTTIMLLRSTSILRFIYGKNKDKRHCACVWMGLQMVGHIYQTTIMLLKSTIILRFIYGKKQGQTPLRMRMDGFADGGTHISYHNHAKTVHIYITLHLRQ